ncbi:hypothetical protein GGF43_006076, partial [Coemansia sp. RSA 2618]
MSKPLKVTYSESLKLSKGSQPSDTIFVMPSNNMLLITETINKLLVARGEKKLDHSKLQLTINNTKSGTRQKLKGTNTLQSIGFEPTKEKDK